MKAAKWVIFNGLLAACAWLGVNGVGGAANVTIFLVWFLAVVSMLTLLPADAKPEDLRRRAERNVPAWVSGGFQAGMVVLFIWHGWWWTGVAFLIYALITQSMRETAGRKLAEAAAKDAA